MDFGNGVHIFLSSSNTLTLQSILAAVAYLIGGIPDCAHISDFIRDSLHWLHLQQHIQFKTLSIICICFVWVAPFHFNLPEIFLHYGFLFTWKGLFVIFHSWSYGYSVYALCYSPIQEPCCTGSLAWNCMCMQNIYIISDPKVAKNFSNVFDPIERLSVPLNYAWRTTKNLNYVQNTDGYRVAFQRVCVLCV